MWHCYKYIIHLTQARGYKDKKDGWWQPTDYIIIWQWKLWLRQLFVYSAAEEAAETYKGQICQQDIL